MIWAVCYIVYFGFLCVSKFTILTDDQYNESCHLSFNSVSVDSKDNPQQLRIRIMQSKIDPFCKGGDIFLGATGDNICPVRGILLYLAMRGDCKGPLFVFNDLTRQ